MIKRLWNDCMCDVFQWHYRQSHHLFLPPHILLLLTFLLSTCLGFCNLQFCGVFRTPLSWNVWVNRQLTVIFPGSWVSSWLLVCSHRVGLWSAEIHLISQSTRLCLCSVPSVRSVLHQHYSVFLEEKGITNKNKTFIYSIIIIIAVNLHLARLGLMNVIKKKKYQ